jgi:hypothetical protein
MHGHERELCGARVQAWPTEARGKRVGRAELLYGQEVGRHRGGRARSRRHGGHRHGDTLRVEPRQDHPCRHRHTRRRRDGRRREQA